MRRDLHRQANDAFGSQPVCFLCRSNKMISGSTEHKSIGWIDDRDLKIVLTAKCRNRLESQTTNEEKSIITATSRIHGPGSCRNEIERLYRLKQPRNGPRRNLADRIASNDARALQRLLENGMNSERLHSAKKLPRAILKHGIASGTNEKPRILPEQFFGVAEKKRG